MNDTAWIAMSAAVGFVSAVAYVIGRWQVRRARRDAALRQARRNAWQAPPRVDVYGEFEVWE